MITVEQAAALADVFDMLAHLYDPHVREKVWLTVNAGNNIVIEWDDMSEDDVEEILCTRKIG